MDANLIAEDPADLSKNQKKKRRQKLSKFYKRAQGAALEAGAERSVELPLPAADGSQSLSESLSKRPKLDPQDAPVAVREAVEDAAPGVCTAEPRQHGAQRSLGSVQAARSDAAQPAMADAFAPAAVGDAEDYGPARVCRLDLTGAALMITSRFTEPGPPANAVAAAGSAAASFAASAGQHWEPAVSSGEQAADDSSGSAPPGPVDSAYPAAAAGGTAAVLLRTRGGGRVFIHGNYHSYYGYRLGQAFSEDPRLELLERAWFRGRRCMDVGCNAGLVTLSLAARFGVRSMVGVDIDQHLVRRACAHLREERTRVLARASAARAPGTPPAERKAVRRALASLAQTWFVHGDFLAGAAAPGSVDTITALSVTKWVHLHAGDAGLRAFFAKVRSLLAPGGHFVVEPQPWRSYQAAAGKMRRQGVAAEDLPRGAYFHRLDQLRLRPEALPDVLCDEFGFRLVRRLQPPSDAAAGFDRHVLVFRKHA